MVLYLQLIIKIAYYYKKCFKKEKKHVGFSVMALDHGV